MNCRRFFKNLLKGAGTVMSIFPVTRNRIKPLYRPAASAEDALAADMAKVDDTFKGVLDSANQQPGSARRAPGSGSGHTARRF